MTPAEAERVVERAAQAVEQRGNLCDADTVAMFARYILATEAIVRAAVAYVTEEGSYTTLERAVTAYTRQQGAPDA